jgi:hypothetical protein
MKIMKTTDASSDNPVTRAEAKADFIRQAKDMKAVMFWSKTGDLEVSSSRNERSPGD